MNDTINATLLKRKGTEALSEYVIREITEADNTYIKQIIQSSLESFGLDIPGTAYFDPQLDELHAYYEELLHAKYWVAEVEGKVVGGIGIAPFDERSKICELQKFYVSPEAQGLGIGKKLMETALDFAAKYYSQCYLETHHKLEVASILYEKYGFTLLTEPIPGSEHSAMDRWYIKNLVE